MRTTLAAVSIVAVACGRAASPPTPAPAPSPAPAPIVVGRDASADVDPPPPPPDDDGPMQLDPAKLAADDAARRTARAQAHAARESPLPARKACTASCDLVHDPRANAECSQEAPGILVPGAMEHIECFATEVIIDCCPPIAADNVPAVMKALGWKAARPAERVAIAWLITRAVLMYDFADTLPTEFETPARFTPPSQHVTAAGDVVIDGWARAYLRHRFYHDEITFHADGTMTGADLGDVKALEDPDLARQQAIDAARRAGVISGSASFP